MCLKAQHLEAAELNFFVEGTMFNSKVGGETVFVDVTMLPFSQDMEIGLRLGPLGGG